VTQRDRLLVGATVSCAGFDTGLTEAAARWLIDRAVAVIPSLRDWPVVEHWAGLRPGSPDDLPLLGRSAMENLFIASGQYRNGILFAPAIADVMRALLLGEAAPPDIGAFDPRRFGASAAKEQAPG
jgi:glycine/D-amino acid oxidase-like deaminating enzyme